MTSATVIMVECSKTCIVIFLGLILMTAGFVLTLTGWFAPPLNNFVLAVRMAGPITLLVGFVFLLCSCLMCAVEQGKCCQCCYSVFLDKSLTGLTIARSPITNGPLIIQEGDRSRFEQFEPISETQVDAGAIDNGGQRTHEEEQLDVDFATVVINENAQMEFMSPALPKHFPKGYQPLATSEKGDIIEELDPRNMNGYVIQNCNVPIVHSLPRPRTDVITYDTYTTLGDVPQHNIHEYILDSNESPTNATNNSSSGRMKLEYSAVDACYGTCNQDLTHKKLPNHNPAINEGAFSSFNSDVPQSKHNDFPLTNWTSGTNHSNMTESSQVDTDNVPGSSRSISRPLVAAACYPETSSSSTNASFSGKKGSLHPCGHHTGDPCPLTPKTKQRKQQSLSSQESAPAKVSVSRNINKSHQQHLPHAHNAQWHERQHKLIIPSKTPSQQNTGKGYHQTTVKNSSRSNKDEAHSKHRKNMTVDL